MDWPHVEETRWTCSQERTGVEPTGQTKERKTPAHLATYENGRVGEETPQYCRVSWYVLVEGLCSTGNEED